MGKAGRALKQVLETYGISQNQLAVTMGIGRSTVHYWMSEARDPLAESVTEIIEALKVIDRRAAREFVKLYVGDIAFEEDDRSTEE